MIRRAALWLVLAVIAAGAFAQSGTPFVVQATMRTGTVGMDQTTIQARLLERLRAGEQAVVEAVFCDGLSGATPSLANNVPAAATLPAALNVVDGVGDLETWLYARQGPRGVLHIPLGLAGRFHAMNLMTFDGRTWRTPLGTAIAFGNYTGHTALGVDPAAGHTTLYVTGSTSIWATPDSQIEYSPWEGNVHWVINQIAAFARREYVVTHNGLLACVDVDIDGAW